MEADNLRLLLQQHCDVFGADIAHHPPRLRYQSQGFCVVMPLQMPSHRLAGLCSKDGLRPERVVDVETAGAQLAEAGDVARRFFRRQTPHTDAAKATCIADRGGQGGRRNYPHRRQDDRKLEAQPLGQKI